jgi:hypothetical protein
MSAEQPINDELAANQIRFDLEARSERAMDSALATAEQSHEINIDGQDRVLNSLASSDGQTFYVALVVSLLAAACGFAWIILSEAALPFGLVSMGGSTKDQNLDPKSGSSSLVQSSYSPSDQMPDIQKGDRLQIRDRIVREAGRDTPAEPPQSPNRSSASPTSAGAAPLTPPVGKHSTVAQQHAASAGGRAQELPTPTKLNPTPETRPTTIEGWTLREVNNGTAVLEGPNGVWRATPGQTVPGVGRVDSIVRWGDRLIVVTSNGLVSTR